jgi:protein SCO1/2
VKLVALGLVLCALCLGTRSAHAQAPAPNFMRGFSEGGALTSATRPASLKEVTFQQRLNEKLPLDATFKDEHGRPVQLGSYFDGHRPVVLAFVYYSCPMLCTQVMNGLSAALRSLSFEAGAQFDVVLISFDARDTPADALEKERVHLDYWKTQHTAAGWHLLTGDEATISRVANAAGFTYRWEESSQQLAHVSGILVATPDGRLSRYFYGIEYSPRELRMAIVESSEGRIGSAVDELLLYCFQYDPLNGRYGVVIRNLMRAGGVLTMAFILGFMWVSRRREPRLPAEGRA